jgi:hypothetical protein
MKKKEKTHYEPPRVLISRVALESGIAVAVSVDMTDWEDGGVIGTDIPAEGGDITLYF